MAKTLTFYWSPQRQSFACDQDVSDGHGAIPTDPSHDLAHLIIAANGGMAWQPQGDRTQVQPGLAEKLAATELCEGAIHA